MIVVIKKKFNRAFQKEYPKMPNKLTLQNVVVLKGFVKHLKNLLDSKYDDRDRVCEYCGTCPCSSLIDGMDCRDREQEMYEYVQADWWAREGCRDHS